MNEEASMDQLFLEKVNEAIENNLANENFGVDELANEIGISRSQLHRRLKSLNGQSASQMIREIRLKKAFQLLQHKVATASEISYQVGFSSPSYFNTCFNEYFGYPPGKVKRIRTSRFSKKYVISRKLIIILTVTLVVVASMIVLYHETRITDKSIAVLPFLYLSDDPNELFLANAVMDAIILNLSRIEDLRVPSRTSVEQYRKTDKSASQICKEQNVAYLLESSFLMFGEQVRIIVQLIRPGRRERHIWAEEYEWNWEDRFSVQSEIAINIARELQAIITPDEKQLIEKIPKGSLTAQTFYQRGWDLYLEYYLEKEKDTAKLKIAEELYYEALESDSTYAPAYIGLAYVVMDSHWKFTSYRIRMDSVMSLANKALSYDDQLAGAYSIRGHYYSWVTGEKEKALEEFNIALKFKPNDWRTLWRLALYYYSIDLPKAIEYLHQAIWLNQRLEEMDEILHWLIMIYKSADFLDKAEYYTEQKLKLNRDSAEYYAYLSWFEFQRGNWDKVIEMCNKRLAIDSTNLDALANMGAAYGILEEYEKSLKCFENLIDILNASVNKQYPFLAGIGIAYWYNGNLEMADYYLEQALEKLNKNIELHRGTASIFKRASLFAFLGMKEEALKDLTEYYDLEGIHYDNLNRMIHTPLFDNLRDDPEFQQILHSMEVKCQAEHERVRKWLEENEML
jgi:TolB-like protein/AraC-like DNA-binding protein/Tfp pilus assembly protein PilF